MITPHLKEAMKHLPDGWFEPYDIPIVNRPVWICKRLEEEGVLESETKLLYDPIRTKTKYRKILCSEKTEQSEVNNT